jgi:hypothetical protein
LKIEGEILETHYFVQLIIIIIIIIIIIKVESWEQFALNLGNKEGEYIL